MTATLTEAEFVLTELIDAIESDHGRVFHDDDGLVCAEAPPLDLGLAYVNGCIALGRTPRLIPVGMDADAVQVTNRRIVGAATVGRYVSAESIEHLEKKFEKMRRALAAEQYRPEGAPTPRWSVTAQRVGAPIWQAAGPRGVWVVTHNRATLITPDGQADLLDGENNLECMNAADMADGVSP